MAAVLFRTSGMNVDPPTNRNRLISDFLIPQSEISFVTMSIERSTLGDASASNSAFVTSPSKSTGDLSSSSKIFSSKTWCSSEVESVFLIFSAWRLRTAIRPRSKELAFGAREMELSE